MIYFILFGVHMLLIGISTSVDSEDIMNTAALQTRPPSRFRWDHSWLTNHFHSYHIFHNGKTQTEFIFKGRDMTSRQFQKSSVGSILVLVIPLQSDSEKMSKRETNEAKEWIQIKKKSFHPSFVWCHFVWSQG